MEEPEEEPEFPPGFPNNWSPFVNHRQQEGESVPFQAETKFFYKQEISGKWKIIEEHRQGVREIFVSVKSRQWISNRLRWKGSNPGIFTSRLRLVEEGVSVSITEKSNSWGIFIAIQVKDSQNSCFVIIPGGKSGEIWGSFASWLHSDGMESREPATRIINHQGIVIAAPLSTNPPLHKSYAEAVLGGSIAQNHSVIESLQKDIALLKADFQLLTEQIYSLERQLAFHSKEVDDNSSNNGGSDEILVQNTDADDETECTKANAQAKGNCDVSGRVLVDDLAGVSTRVKTIATFHREDNLIEPHNVIESIGAGSCPQDIAILSGSFIPVGNVMNPITLSAIPEEALPTRDAVFAEGSEEAANISTALTISDTASTALIAALNAPGPFIRKSSRSRWQIAWQRLKKRNEEQICKAWKSVTDESRYRKTVVVPEKLEVSSSISTTDLSADECALFIAPILNAVVDADTASQEFIAPFLQSEVPGVENLVVAEMENDIAAGISAGYPEFLCRIEMGVVSLSCWLAKAERKTMKATLPSGFTVGKTFIWGENIVHGLTLRRALRSTKEVKNSEKVFLCWKRLVGLPILEFLKSDGFSTDDSWLLDGPPRLSDFGY